MVSSFPLVSFLITLILAAAVCTNGKEQVKDAAGNAVQTNEQYFIQPVNTVSNGGGLIPFPVTYPFCPLGINQIPLPEKPGLPVSFAYPYPLVDTNVYETEFVNIDFKFDSWPFCMEFSTLWEVDESSPASDESTAILIGGKQLERNSWFRIERDTNSTGGNIYKLTTTFEGIVGTIPGPWGDAPQLVLTNDTAKTLLVKFNKVDIATTATTSTTSTPRVGKLSLRRMFPFY